MGVHQKRTRDDAPGHHVEPEAEGGGTHTDGPGLTSLRQLAQRGPDVAALAAIVAAHPDEQSAMIGLLHTTFGNHFVSEVLRAIPRAVEPKTDAAPGVNADGPLAAAIEVDPRELVSGELARGEHDENQITNEVLWQRHPALRGKKLNAGSPAALEWLRLRDAYVIPALELANPPKSKDVPQHKGAVVDAAPAEVAPVTKDPSKGAPDVVQKLNPDQVTANPKNAPAQRTVAKTSGDPAIDALLAWTPVGIKGEQGQAAWLLAAIATKLIGAHSGPKTQLAQLAAGSDTVRSEETDPGSFKAPHKNVKKVGPGEYDIKLADAPIIPVLVRLASHRIQDWIDEGSGKPRLLFELGVMARGDLGFKGTSAHSQGAGIDIDFGDYAQNKKAFNTDDEVLALLEVLEPGQVGMVFPDNLNHIHIGVLGGKYEIGLPFQGAFYPYDKSIDAAKAKAEKAVANPQMGQQITAEGMDVYSPYLRNTIVAKYGIWPENEKGVIKWWWAPSSTADTGSGPAVPHIKSARIKQRLAELNIPASTKVPQAKADDGHEDRAETLPPIGDGQQQTNQPRMDGGAKADAPKAVAHEEEKCEGNCGHDHGSQMQAV